MSAEDLVGTILVPVLMLTPVLVFLLIWYRRWQRGERLRGFAATRGWTYLRRDNTLVDRFAGYPFGAGRVRVARHVLVGGHRGRRLVTFEYTTSASRSGRGRSAGMTFTVTAVALPTTRPTLQVTREHAGHRLLGLVGVHDLRLESTEFNAAFRISTDSDRFAYDVLHPRMMAHLLADPRATAWPFRFERADLLTWRDTRISPDEIGRQVDYLCDLLDRVPDFVWRS